MSIPTELLPTQKPRLIDLLANAGVDVSDWKNFAGGERRAASNPKYCYEWAFIQPGKVVVLNLWYADLIEENGSIVQRLNYRELAKKFRRQGRGVRIRWTRRYARPRQINCQSAS